MSLRLHVKQERTLNVICTVLWGKHFLMKVLSYLLQVGIAVGISESIIASVCTSGIFGQSQLLYAEEKRSISTTCSYSGCSTRNFSGHSSICTGIITNSWASVSNLTRNIFTSNYYMILLSLELVWYRLYINQVTRVICSRSVPSHHSLWVCSRKQPYPM